MRGAPQSKFSFLINRISARNLARSAVALPVDAISTANSGESRPDANAPALGSNDHESRKDRREPAIELDEEPAIVVREPGSAGHLAPQNDQLMSERRILSFKPALRLERRGEHGQDEAEQCNHCALTLGDSVS